MSSSVATDTYLEYLNKHKDYVRQSYENIYLPILISEGVDQTYLDAIQELIDIHDDAKRFYPSYDVYKKFFEGGYVEGKDNPEYQLAWCIHQHTQPHHWQYWVLLRDSESPHQVVLDIPLVYIIEMLCDWTSASYLHGSTAHEWYSQQKDNMLLSPKTRDLVEHYLKKSEGIKLDEHIKNI